jgi:hypothetical protein
MKRNADGTLVGRRTACGTKGCRRQYSDEFGLVAYLRRPGVTGDNVEEKVRAF